MDLGGLYFWLGASADAETGSRADASSPTVSTKGFDPARWYGRTVARCMGGRYCGHHPGECTADPEYQRFCEWQRTQRPGAEL